MTTLFILCIAGLPAGADAPHQAAPIACSVMDAIEHGGGRAKLWVFLADKGFETDARRLVAVADAAANYDGRALRRRVLRRTTLPLFDGRDVPVCERYVQQIAASGAAVCRQSRWLNAVSVRADLTTVRALAALPFVRSIEPVRRAVRTEAVPVRDVRPAVPPTTADFWGLSSEQLRQIRITDMHTAGWTGAGVVIGVLDTGFKRTHEAYNFPGHEIDVIAEYDFVNDDPNTAPEQGDDPGQHWHGTFVLGTIAAYKPDTLIGGAYDAAFILTKTEDITQEVPAEEDAYVAGLEFIEANGGDLTTSSLGYIDWYTQRDLDGRTAVTTIGVNTAIENGLICVTAAGNGGHRGEEPTLIAPADAFDVFTCGAVNVFGEIAGFSSRGPTADGRVKPEVLACGDDTRSLNPDDDAGYTGASGTSCSTPFVASAAALLIQAHPAWTVKHFRRALFDTADYYLAHGTYDPEWIYGYGVIDAFAASQVLPGDANCDGLLDAFDIEPFALALFDPGQYESRYPGCNRLSADVNGDGGVDAFDIEPFIDLLFGP